jgi:putative membrane protein
VVSLLGLHQILYDAGTNASYQRWLEGQNNITNIVSQLKNLLRMTSTWLPAGAEGQQIVKDTGLACWAVLRSVQSHLRSPEQEEAGFSAHVRKTLDEETAEKLLSSKDRPFWAIHDLSAIIQKMPIDGGRVREMDKAIVSIMCSIESCTKSIRYPIPLVYTRLTARFLTAWLLLLPLAMYESFAQNRLLLVPTSAFISFFFFGIDELAIQLEEPFSILPLEYNCANIKQMAKQAVLWHTKAQ